MKRFHLIGSGRKTIRNDGQERGRRKKEANTRKMLAKSENSQ
jgi:hypothetical protein